MAKIDISSHVGECITAVIMDEVHQSYPEHAFHLLRESFASHKFRECG